MFNDDNRLLHELLSVIPWAPPIQVISLKVTLLISVTNPDTLLKKLLDNSVLNIVWVVVDDDGNCVSGIICLFIAVK